MNNYKLLIKLCNIDVYLCESLIEEERTINEFLKENFETLIKEISNKVLTSVIIQTDNINNDDEVLGSYEYSNKQIRIKYESYYEFIRILIHELSHAKFKMVNIGNSNLLKNKYEKSG